MRHNNWLTARWNSAAISCRNVARSCGDNRQQSDGWAYNQERERKSSAAGYATHFRVCEQQTLEESRLLHHEQSLHGTFCAPKAELLVKGGYMARVHLAATTATGMLLAVGVDGGEWLCLL